ncbi:D-site 20S pre-rRNA nuclease [Mytilinidion resinicola]|uniref:20S-pre-rRNA D-site endonuclease NOB1 n=1 Tax=Mytilinidion resinicola TaxID=574789 RepID=A0A6A6XZP1_9PEZI|nr:D-site 20S pre-rRNA nuclease [Mytilinidion resinicola]KAF2801758.1 D-site 20S pre-rRNA nuclease [Mytilinidion resinicola]
MASSDNPVHTLILDAGPIIKNIPAVSSLLAQSEALITTPAVVREIRDPATRSRLETTLLPFLTIRNPTPASYEVVAQFSKKTGDFAVLSRPDLEILALAYELECEKNGGNWRLRSIPGQKELNGPFPSKEKTESANAQQKNESQTDKSAQETPGNGRSTTELPTKLPTETPEAPSEEEWSAATAVDSTIEVLEISHTAINSARTSETGGVSITANESSEPLRTEEAPKSHSNHHADAHPAEQNIPISQSEDVEPKLAELRLSDSTEHVGPVEEDSTEEVPQLTESSDDSDGGGWITPSNLKKHQTKESNKSFQSYKQPKTMSVATLTTDFAMQNVLLQMNLNLLSTSLARISRLNTYILRCYACFLTTKLMDKQFCPRCGKPSLTRVACSTSSTGEFKLHLKKNFQWNHRGERYSIPKAVHGSSNGKRDVGGGKGGWGQELILAEDQKEYARAIEGQRRQKTRDLMDEDYLPGILTGDRNKAGSRPKVGAGRNVNSRKRMT